MSETNTMEKKTQPHDYKKTSNDSINILLKYNNSTSSQTTMVLLSSGAGGGERLSVTQLGLPVKSCGGLYPHEFSLVGHCNGVLCLCGPTYRCLCGSVILYNPTIGESKVVPQPSSSTFDKSQYSRRVKFGFGCDPKNNDLVVIMISTFLSYPNSKADHTSRKLMSYTLFEEYSLRTNSWRKVFKSTEKYFIKTFWVFHKGIYYWTCEEKGPSEREVILMFDSEKEVIRIAPMPISDEDFSSGAETCLGMIHDSLALVCCNNATSYFRLFVMDMDKGNLGDSWTMIANLVPNGVWPFLVPLKGNGILIGMTTEYFIVYDLSTKQVKKLVLDSSVVIGGGGAFGDLHAVSYVQNITSVNRRN